MRVAQVCDRAFEPNSINQQHIDTVQKLKKKITICSSYSFQRRLIIVHYFKYDFTLAKTCE